MIDSSPPESGSNLPAPYNAGRPPVAAILGRNSAPPGGMMYDEQGIPWARYFDAIKRQLWLVLLIAGAGIAAGYYLSTQVSPQYESEAKVMVYVTGNQQSATVGGEPVLRSSASWDQLIKSYAVLEPVVRDLSLYIGRSRRDDSLFATFAPPDTSGFHPGRYRLEVDSTGQTYTLTAVKKKVAPERGAVGDSIGRTFGFQWAPPANLLPAGKVVNFSVTTIQAAAGSLIGNLATGMPEQGQFLNLRLTGTDPVRTTQTLNAWATQFVSTAFDYKKGSLTSTRATVEAQLKQVQKQLSDDEGAVQRFRERTQFAMDNGAAPTNAGVATYMQLQNQLDSIQMIRMKLDTLVTDTGPGGKMDPERFYLIPAVLANWPHVKKAVEDAINNQHDIDVKRQTVTATNIAVAPLIEAQNKLQTVTLPSMTKDIIVNLRQSEKTLRARLDTLGGSLRVIPQLAIQGQQLNSRAAATQAIYASLQSKNESLKLAESETYPDLKFFQPALVPTSPSTDQGPRLFLMAIVASISAGLALALLRDRFDRRFRYPEQAAVDLGLTIVGTVPNLSFRRGDLSVSATFQVVESFRILRLAVRYHFNGRPVVLCVSSPGAGEGKSLVSSNLAVAFANAGQKTLLIDGDVRRGVVHTTFGVQRRPGLVDYLGRNADAQSVIQNTATTNLSVIASGSHSRKAPEFLVAGRLATLVADMRERFDVVIVDSAPFAAGMDAYAVGAAAGAMLVVLRRGVTDRNLAAAKLEILDRLPVSILGCVVNGISNSASYRYYAYDGGYAIDEQLKEEADFPDVTENTGPVRLAGK